MAGSITYPLQTLSVTITDTGISGPTLDEIITSLQTSYGQIYGTDNVWDPSTQDTQWIAIIAQAIYDCNQSAIAVYNQFSPSTAVGTGLSSVVKINGLRREASSNSTVDLLIGGNAGLIINGGTVGDSLGLGTEWTIANSFTIGPTGTLEITGTCTVEGAVQAAAGTLTEILTPTAGWASVTNPSNASPGAPVETDAQLRQRQSVSTNLPALTPFDAVVASIRNVAGVTAVGGYVNNSATVDVNGVPPYAWALVVQGGAIQDIVNAIGLQKTPGPPTFGTTSGTYVSPYGIPETIQFSVPTEVLIDVSVGITPLTGYTSAIGGEIQNAVSAYVNGLGFPLGSVTGNNVLITRLYAPSLLQWSGAPPAGANDPNTYELNSVAAAVHPGTPGTVDVTIGWNQIAVADTVTVTT